MSLVPLNLSGVVACFFTDALTITRYAATTYSSGIAVDGATSALTVNASVQPVNGEELNTLRELERVTHALRLYTIVPLQIGTEAGAERADTFSYNGVQYEVRVAENTFGNLGSFYRYVAVAE